MPRTKKPPVMTVKKLEQLLRACDAASDAREAAQAARNDHEKQQMLAIQSCVESGKDLTVAQRVKRDTDQARFENAVIIAQNRHSEATNAYENALGEYVLAQLTSEQHEQVARANSAGFSVPTTAQRFPKKADHDH